MRIRLLYIFFILILTVVGLAQKKDPSITANFTFNDSKEENEIKGKPAKFVNALHVSDRFGNPEFAAYVHGSLGSYLNLGTGPELKPQIGSVCQWFKIEAISYGGKGHQCNPIILTENGVLDSNGRNDDFNEAYTISYDFKVHKLVGTTNFSEKFQVVAHSQDTISLFQWHHVVLTFDDHETSFYLDGVLNSKLPKRHKTIYSKTDSVLVGNVAHIKNERYFCGAVDDIVIYNRVINAEEVRYLYNAPDPNKLNYYLKWIKWIVFGLIIIGAIIWLFLRKLKKDLELQKEKNKINARMNELETRAIRTQMNPHFMFNSLNTLQRFILEEDTINANSYLVKFSKLLRKLLETSVSESISLKEEIEILNSYIEIEKLRFDRSFEYNINSNIPEPAAVFLPFMLIQPFVENAIWHGLLPKADNRRLTVSFSNMNENKLLCTIEDNGVGRNYSFTQKDPFRKKSMAIDFITQRLEILKKVTGVACTIKIVDKKDEQGNALGTLVEIVIPKLKNEVARSSH